MTVPRRLTLVISSLGPGGAERVLTTIANSWVQKGAEVTLISLAPLGADFYPIDPRISRVGLDLLSPSRGPMSAAAANLRRAQALRGAVLASRPDVIISFGDRTNLLTLISTLRLPIPVIVCERSDPRSQRLGWLPEQLRRSLYPKASALVVQTEVLRAWAVEISGTKAVHVVPNPLSFVEQDAHAPDAREQTLLSVGRLTPEKGHDLLLRSFARVYPRHRGWRLRIVGDGPSRSLLKSLAEELGISSAVDWTPLERNLAPLLRSAGLFVLPSRYEGFPNALLEAMAHGVPVAAFDCPSGPGEIVTDGVDGLLAPPGDVGALAAAIERLIGDGRLRARLGDAASRSVVSRFNLATVMQRWEGVLAGALEKGQTA